MTDPPLEIFQQPEHRATIQLEPHQGEALRSLIVSTTHMSFNRYVEKVGLQPTNVSNYLSGRNRMSFATLYKLLAGTNLHLTCLLQVTITNGSVVESADCIPLEEMLFSPEPDTSVEDITSTPPTCPQDILESFLSEKHLNNKRTTPDSLSKETVVEYSTPSGPSLLDHFHTQLQTQLGVDPLSKTTEDNSSTENPPLQK
jgi:transcriptional regulator with XRE-family HTH domain